MTYRIDYEHHDEVYRRRKAEGASGWDDVVGYEEHLEELHWALPHLKTGKRLLELGSGAGEVSL